MGDAMDKLGGSIERLFSHGFEWRRRAEIAEAELLTLKAQLQKAQEWREKAEKVVEKARRLVECVEGTAPPYHTGPDGESCSDDMEWCYCFKEAKEALSALETGKEKQHE